MKRSLAGLTLILVSSGAIALWSLGVLQPASSRDRITHADSVSQPRATTWVKGLGYVEPASEIRRLVFKIDGVIDSCRVTVGQSVFKNNILMTLNSNVHEAALSVAAKELELARATRDQILAGTPPYQIAAAEHKVGLLKELVRHAQKLFDRSDKLFQKKVMTQEDLDQCETDLIRSRIGLHQSESDLLHLKNIVRLEDKRVVEAKVRLAEAQLALAQEQLENTRLKAPTRGTVLDILRREGESSKLPGRDAVIVFSEESNLRIRSEIDERFVSLVKVGQSAVIHGQGLGQQKPIGKVVLVKKLMGPKRLFANDASERMDLDIIEALIEMPEDFQAPFGLQVDVQIASGK